MTEILTSIALCAAFYLWAYAVYLFFKWIIIKLMGEKL